MKMFFLLQEGVERYGHCIHAFWLMSNQVHSIMHRLQLTVELLLRQFSGDSGTTRRLYNDFVCPGETEGIRQEFHCGSTEGRMLGDDVFVEQVLAKTSIVRFKNCIR